MDFIKNSFNVYSERLEQKSFLVLGFKGNQIIEKDDLKMLSSNKCKYFLELDFMQRDNELGINYDVTSKIKLTSILNKIDDKSFISILQNIIEGINEASKYMLNANNIAIHEEYIYVDAGLNQISLVYVPTEEELFEDINQALRKFLIRIIDMKENMGDVLYAKLSRGIKKEKLNIKEIEQMLTKMIMPSVEKRKNANNSRFEKEPEPFREPQKKTMKENIRNDEKPQNTKRENIKKEEPSVQKKNINKKKEKGKKLIFAGIIVLILAVIAMEIFGGEDSYQETDFTTYIAVLLLFGVGVVAIMRRKTGKLNKKTRKTNQNSNEIKQRETPKNIQNKLKNQEVPKNIDYQDYYQEQEGTGVLGGDENEGTVILDGCALENEGVLIPKIKDKFSKIFINRESIIIGSSPKNMVDVIISSQFVSRIHGELIKRQKQYFIKDLNSRNGIFIDSKRIPNDTEIKINQGERIRIGDVDYEFRLIPKSMNNGY